ncbi:uncharacterized protein TNCV_3251781 [Trichonephila clavipes]|nr:uncharacterized protein TNCV_3251781 [Trichonephila clavipes]
MRTDIWQLLPNETDGAQYQTYPVSSLQLPVRQFQGRPCTDQCALTTLVYMLVGLSDVFHLPQLTVAPRLTWSREHALCGHHNSGLV